MLFVFSSFFILSETRFVSLFLHFAKGFLILIFTRTGGDEMFGFSNLFVQDRRQGRGTVSNAESIRDQTTVLKKNGRTEVLLPERAVPRCHGCVETKKKEAFRLRIENPTTPSPPSLRSFLLSVVSSRSAACRRATTTAGCGRRHRQDHDHQYDAHIVLVR